MDDVANEMTRVLYALADVRNRGHSHLILGDPFSDLADKTVVEPGGAFSPGLWTCGISVWITGPDGIHTADLLPDADIGFRFADADMPPIVCSSWCAGDATVTVNITSLGGEGAEGADFVRVTVVGGTANTFVHVVVRGEGPAGHKQFSAAWEENILHLGGGRRLSSSPLPLAHTINTTANGDVAAILSWRSSGLDGAANLDLVVEHAFQDRVGGDLIPVHRPFAGMTVSDGFESARERWQQAVPATIETPDEAINRAWQQSAFHILSSAEGGVARIGAVDYPGLWMRDAVIQAHALDCLGRHDMARIICEELAPAVFVGGFGAEADAPGEGIWALTKHVQFTHDIAWLEAVFPAIQKRISWLERMRSTDRPIYAPSFNRMPRYLDSPAINLVCLPSDDGLIRGRMDWQFPDFYINCWAVAGYRHAAIAARMLNQSTVAESWDRTADEIDDLVAQRLLPLFGNERDSVVAPYPTGALVRHRDALARQFAEWFTTNRQNADGTALGEPLWTYFEAAQAHNSIALGAVANGFQTLKRMLTQSPGAALASFGEGEPGGNEFLPFGKSPQSHGWLDPRTALNGNMPHGWSSAEVITAVRSLLIDDSGEYLVIGSGAPKEWFAAGTRFAAHALPTRWGPVSFSVSTDDRGTTTAEVDADFKWRVTAAPQN